MLRLSCRNKKTLSRRDIRAFFPSLSIYRFIELSISLDNSRLSSLSGDQIDQLWLFVNSLDEFSFNLSLLQLDPEMRRGIGNKRKETRGTEKFEQSGGGTLPARCLRAIEGKEAGRAFRRSRNDRMGFLYIAFGQLLEFLSDTAMKSKQLKRPRHVSSPCPAMTNLTRKSSSKR